MLLQASVRRLPSYSVSSTSYRSFTVSGSSSRPSTSNPRLTSLSQITSGTIEDRLPPSAIAIAPTKFRRQRREEQKLRKKIALKRKATQTPEVARGLTKVSVAPYVRIDRQFKTFKPITHSLRWVRTPLTPQIYRGRPLRALTRAKRRTGGRNHHGRITVRGRGGGHKRRIRLVDFHRREAGAQEVVRIEYDPNRSAHLALIKHKQSGLHSYIIAAEGLGVGDTVESYRRGGSGTQALSGLDLGIFRTKAIRPGNVLPLRLIPIGTTIYNISLLPIGPAKLVRSAGASGTLISFVNRSKAKPKPAVINSAANSIGSPSQASLSILPGSESLDEMDEKANQSSEMTTHAQVKLQSGEVRLLLVDCHATIGRASNVEHDLIRIGKAGRTRWLGRKPKVRGVAMNAVDHPHGGGRGKSKSNMHPKDIYGNKTKGPRTRRPSDKNGNKMVVRQRPRSVRRMLKSGSTV